MSSVHCPLQMGYRFGTPAEIILEPGGLNNLHFQFRSCAIGLHVSLASAYLSSLLQARLAIQAYLILQLFIALIHFDQQQYSYVIKNV